MKPKEYKSTAEQEEKGVDENGDIKTTIYNIHSLGVEHEPSSHAPPRRQRELIHADRR